MFKSKKDKCILFIEDICDSKDKLKTEEKEKLRMFFLDISNIHRTFVEDLITAIGIIVMKKFWGKFFFFTYFLVVLGVAYLLKWPKQFDRWSKKE